MADVAIERVARIADGFLSTQNAHQATYLDAVRRHRGDLDEAAIYAGQWTIIADDPEREWAKIGDHALYQMNEYVAWGAFGPPDQVPTFPDRDAIVAGGAYEVWDPDTAIAEITALLAGTPQIRDVHFWAQLPGEPVDSGSARIELLATKVLPRVRQALAGGAPHPTSPRPQSRGDDTMKIRHVLRAREPGRRSSAGRTRRCSGRSSTPRSSGSTRCGWPSTTGRPTAACRRPRWRRRRSPRSPSALRIGIAVSILPFGNPVRTAEDYAMVDVISNGRLDMGVGRGYQPREFAMLGLADQQQHSRAIFNESLEVLIGLWENETFSYHGEYYQFDNVSAHARVRCRSRGRRSIVAAISPESFDLVEKYGLNIMVTPTLMSLPELKENVIDAKQRLIKAGRTAGVAELPDELADAPRADP